MKNKNQIKKLNISKGLTLVELMVAMTIGLFLVLALTSIYIVIKNNFLSSNSITNTQENHRLIFNNISRSIQTAGYILSPFTETQEQVFTANSLFIHDGQFIFGTDTPKKSISVRYQTSSGDSVLNCNGSSNDSGANGIFTNTFTLEGNDLTCSSRFNNETEIKTVLASNVADINIIYGIDTNDDSIADSYASASSVGAGNWRKVHSVMLSVKFIDISQQKTNPYFYTQVINLMNKVS
ncbi:PilW family protein [Comamonas aquatica]|uniref:PilW family protein n=1 Tax=Comamonas aquatica TaxID=225991 RepID=UPI0034D7AFE2